MSDGPLFLLGLLLLVLAVDVLVDSVDGCSTVGRVGVQTHQLSLLELFGPDKVPAKGGCDFGHHTRVVLQKGYTN